MPPPSSRPVSRATCLVSALILLLAFGLLGLTLAVAVRGEAQVGSPGRHVRLFFVDQPEAQGLALETVWPYAQNAACLRVRERFWLWRGSGDSVTYCECNGSVLPCP